MSLKTELPTPHRLREARKEGQVAHSKDVTHTVLVVSLFTWILVNSESLVASFAQMMVLPAGVLHLGFAAALDALATQLLRRAVEILAPFLIIVLLVGLLTEFLQTGFNVSFKAATPSGKKINPVNNAKNIFSARNLFEFIKSAVKISLLSTLVFMIVRDALPTLVTLPHGGIAAVGVATAILLKNLMIYVGLGYGAIAVADYVFQKRNHIKQLMMSKDEVMREQKDLQGNPEIKQRRRELHKELLDATQANNVRQASAVVTNPIHFAVAIAYQPGYTPLPVVVAKGAATQARQIVEIARECGIPVLENVPLARALMHRARLNSFVPRDLLEAVAEILRLVKQMKEEEEDDEGDEEH